MTILITGGAGYIGSHMVHELLDAGETVVVLDNLSTGQRLAVPEGVPFFTHDAGDRSVVSRLICEHDVETIFHLAASVVVSESVANPLRYYFNNTVTSQNLIDAAIEGGVRHFIFASTAAVYGDLLTLPVIEDAATSPLSPYGWSKLMTEIALRNADQTGGLKYAIMRFFNVAGADEKQRAGQSLPDSQHLIKAAVQAALGLQPKIKIFGTDYPTPDGTCIRDYIHVSDLARALSDTLNYLRRGGASTTINCGYGHGFSVFEIIEAVKQISGVDFAVERSGRRPGDLAQIVASSDRARATLGWRPRFDDLATIVSHALAWERKLQATQS